MSGIPLKYRETFVRLKRATTQLHNLIETGEFHALGYLKRRTLTRRIRRLYNQLAGPVSPMVIKGALATAGVLALAGCWGREAEPQVPDFVNVDATTIGLGGYDPTGRPDGFLVLADTDGDGDLDIYYSEYYPPAPYGEGAITRQKNDGSGSFEAKERDPDGLVAQASGMLGFNLYPLAFVDIDGDGDLDLLAGGDYYLYLSVPWTWGTMMIVPNEGTPNSPSFGDPVLFAQNAGLPQYVDAAAFVDIDSDGDLDLVTIQTDHGPGGDSYVYLTPNTSGTMSSFTAADDSTIDFPYSDYLLSERRVNGLAITDLDQDGDLDIMMSYYVEWYSAGDNTFRVINIDNQSTEDAIVFATSPENPYNIAFPQRDHVYTDTDEVVSLAAGDIDNDGDIDLILGTYSHYASDDTEFFYFENQAAQAE
jgi:hypothetical protein